MGSVVVAQGLSCSAVCEILVPQPGIKPKSPELQGKFLTTGLPGKSLLDFILSEVGNTDGSEQRRLVT